MVWAISDLHLDPFGDKPMDIFGDNWARHEEKIVSNWKKLVGQDDLVLVPGDISWGLKLEDAKEDLKLIDSLPGYKVFIKGNHDYWWSSKAKLDKLDLKTIHFIYNDHLIYENYVIYGTRGWDPRDSLDFDDQDERIFKRELNRLKLSFDSYKDKDKIKIAMVHYPPFNQDTSPNEFLDLMVKEGVGYCVYGHLHGQGLSNVQEGLLLGIETYCVSSDYLDFKPIRII